MKSKRLPLSETSVSANVSIASALDYLESLGFSKVAQIREDGNNAIIAEMNGVPFRWAIQTDQVIDALVDNEGSRTKKWIRHKDDRGIEKLEKIRDKAGRIAWRIVADQIRATAIMIQYGAMDLPTAFGGYVVARSADGSQTTLGHTVAQMITKGDVKCDRLLPMLGGGNGAE